MKISRRRLLGYLLVLSGTYLGSSCGRRPSPGAAVLSQNPDDFEPSSPVYYLGGCFVWVGSLKVGSSLKFVLISKRGADSLQIMTSVQGPILVRDNAESCLYARALGGHSLQVTSLSGASLEIAVLQDQGQALEACQFSRAKARDWFTQIGFTRLAAASVGQRASLPEAPVLTVRPYGDVGSPESEFLLFDDNADPLWARVSWPISRDNPVLMANPHGLDWLVYPSFNFKRRQELREQLEGIPVCRVARDLSLDLAWVPWADWNESGPYRFYSLGSELVAITLSGIFQEFSGAEGWVPRFRGEFDPDSLAVSADHGQVAWIERIKLPTRHAVYGQYRKIVRIEAV